MAPKENTKKGSEKWPGANFGLPPEMNDALPSYALWRKRIRKQVDDLATFYHFHRIETPAVESRALFLRGLGMDGEDPGTLYGVKMGKGDWVLRPDSRIPALRAYFAHSLGRQSQPQRLWHEGEIYRASRINHGRVGYEAGFEVIGGQNDPLYDAQVMLLVVNLLKGLKLTKSTLKVNSLGCRVCRPLYKRQLQSYYGRIEKELCRDCIKDIKTQPLRLLECKKDKCTAFRSGAPNILDRICAPCISHFRRALEYLDELKVEYVLDNCFLGTDAHYWNRTVFGCVMEGVGASLASGGRYDYLAETIGGRPTPAVGASVVYERLVEAMRVKETKPVSKQTKKVFVIHVGDIAKRKAMKLVEDLKGLGIPVGESFGKESLRSQLKSAEKEGYDFVLILGQREVYEESIILRDLGSSTQETIPLARLEEELRTRTKKQ